MGQINLNNFKVITDKLNTFFVDNKFMVASEIPTEGEFKVGDIIINNGPTNVDEPMWICIEAGNPGTWTVFNSGGGSGGRLSTARNRVVLDGESKSEVSIGISGFNKSSDVFMVFINSRFMTEGVDYEINDDSTKIVAIGEAWNEELSSEFEIEMIVFKMMGEEGVVSSVNEIVKLKNTVVVNEAVNEVEIGIEGFNEGDDLTVYRNSVYMIEGIDYEIQESKIVSLKGAWNAEGGSDYKFTFEVLKAVAKVNPDAVVGMEHLTEDVKEAIEAAGNIDLSGYATKEELNELFQDVDSGKGIIADAIDDINISKDSTFAAMGEAIEGIHADREEDRQKLIGILQDSNMELTGEESMADLIVKVGELNNVNIPTWVDTKKGISIKASSIPSARTAFGIAYVDGYIYTIGGYNNTTQVNSLPKAIYRYNVNENTWELMNGTSGVLATVQYGGYYNHTSSAVGTVIYSFAGSKYIINNQGYYTGGGDDSSIRAYDTLTDTTTGLGDLSVSTATSSGHLISCTYGTDIYCFGGSYTSNGTNYNLNILYNTLTNTCTRKLNMPAHRSHPCVGEVEGLLYCIGGGYGTMHNTNYCYDPLTNSWSEKTTMPGTSVYSNSVTMNKKIYIISEKLSVCYDPINDEWSDVILLTDERLLPGLATDGERIYAIGGNGPVNTNECFIIR